MASARICLQWTLIVFATFSFIIGIAAIICGAFQLQKCINGTANCPDQITQIVIVSVLVISAIVACCGSVNGSIKILCAYLILLLIMMAAHGWMLWRYDEAKQMKLVEEMVTYLFYAGLAPTQGMEELQREYQCCGRDSYKDYPDNIPLSRSCFHPNTLLSDNPYKQGCWSAVKHSYLRLYRCEYWVHVGLLAFEGFGVLLTTILILKLMTKTRRYHY